MDNALDNFVNIAMVGEDDADLTDMELVELAGCVEINLENIRRVAESNPIVGLAWAQAMALAKVVLKREE